MKLFRSAALFIVLAALAGCRAHMVTVKLTNTSAEPISTIIVDYPSATFGKDKLAPGETFTSPVKLTDDGALKIQFTDAKGGNHTYTGPVLHRNEGGSIAITVRPNYRYSRYQQGSALISGRQQFLVYCRSGGSALLITSCTAFISSSREANSFGSIGA